MHNYHIQPSPPPRHPHSKVTNYSLSRKAHSLTKRHSVPRHPKRQNDLIDNAEEMNSMYYSCHEQPSKHSEVPSKIKYYIKGKPSPKMHKVHNKSSIHRQSKVKSHSSDLTQPQKYQKNHHKNSQNRSQKLSVEDLKTVSRR